MNDTYKKNTLRKQRTLSLTKVKEISCTIVVRGNCTALTQFLILLTFKAWFRLLSLFFLLNEHVNYRYVIMLLSILFFFRSFLFYQSSGSYNLTSSKAISSVFVIVVFLSQIWLWTLYVAQWALAILMCYHSSFYRNTRYT